MMGTKEARLQGLLEGTGVVLNGPHVWDPQIKNPRFYDRVFAEGSVGVGESYMDGDWECGDLSGLTTRLLRHDIRDRLFSWRQFGLLWYLLQARFTNMQSRARAFQVGEEHYNAGNDLFAKMLDSRMIYSCGYWRDVDNLDDAQEAKLDLICRKVGLKPGDHILDIGCGWGGFLKFAAERYGVSGVGLTISTEQAALAREVVKDLPVEIRVLDYRALDGAKEQFDHVISIGMFEHVGPKNYAAYFRKVHDVLRDDGLFLLHTIGSRFTVTTSDPWFDKYIFPNGVLPSVENIGAATNHLFQLEDWHNFGPDYDKTLLAWYDRFVAAWPTLKDAYSDRFYRMWEYYLLSVAGSFRARNTHLWQMVFSKRGIMPEYRSIR